MKVLDELGSAEIRELAMTIATVDAFAGRLRGLPEVRRSREGLQDGAINSDDIEDWIRDRLSDLLRGVRFRHDEAFCALAVALETVPMSFAESLLQEMSKLKLLELPLSPRVADLALRRRQRLLIANTHGHRTFSPPDSPTVVGPPELDASPIRISIDSTSEEPKSIEKAA